MTLPERPAIKHSQQMPFSRAGDTVEREERLCWCIPVNVQEKSETAELHVIEKNLNTLKLSALFRSADTYVVGGNEHLRSDGELDGCGVVLPRLAVF